MATADPPAAHDTPTRPYRCFLIRCWLDGEEADGAPGWRFAVQQPEDAARRRLFGRLADLEAYLEAELALKARAEREADR